MTEWLPSTSTESLAARAELLQVLRQFFSDRGVMEVETPLLSQGTVPDAGIDVFRLPGEGDGIAAGFARAPDERRAPAGAVVPEGEEVLKSTNLGRPVITQGAECDTGAAYEDVVKRFLGEECPLRFTQPREKGFLSGLFGK